MSHRKAITPPASQTSSSSTQQHAICPLPTLRACLVGERGRQRLPQLQPALAGHRAEAVAQLLELGGHIGGGSDEAGGFDDKLAQLVPHHLQFNGHAEGSGSICCQTRP